MDPKKALPNVSQENCELIERPCHTDTIVVVDMFVPSFGVPILIFPIFFHRMPSMPSFWLNQNWSFIILFDFFKVPFRSWWLRVEPRFSDAGNVSQSQVNRSVLKTPDEDLWDKSTQHNSKSNNVKFVPFSGDCPKITIVLSTIKSIGKPVMNLNLDKEPSGPDLLKICM